MVYSNTPTTENLEETLGIQAVRGRLRLRLPRSLYDGKQKYLSLGIDDTPENQKVAKAKAIQIESDIAHDRFDITLNKYRAEHLRLVEPGEKPTELLSLTELWTKYVAFKTPQVQAKTVYQYGTFTNHIHSLPTSSLNDAGIIKDWLVENLSPRVAKDLLVQLNAACKWGIKSKLLFFNPFDGMAKEIKLAKADDEEIDPFSVAERDLIIDTFERHPQHSRYSNLVKFLFWTGCRPSEAVGLQWQDINQDCSLIKFQRAVVNIKGKPVSKNSTKTHKPRSFPVKQAKLKQLLLAIKPENPDPEQLVFSLDSGAPINWHNFSQRAWKGINNGSKKRYHGIVTELVEQGKLKHYRNPYQTKHTFATLAVANGVKAADVARLVGDRLETFEKHYLGKIHDLEIPEF